MIELAGAFEAGTAGLGLVGEAIAIVQRLRAHGERDITLSRLLDALRARAIEVSQQIESELASVRQDLEEAGIAWDRSINELLGDARWYQWGIKSTLRDARDRFGAMGNTLRLLIDDITALLLCSGTIKETNGAFAQAQEEKNELLTRLSTEMPLRSLLNELARSATQLTERANTA